MTATVSGPDLVEAIAGHRNVGVLDANRWGRFLPAQQVGPGTGGHRRLTVKDAAVAWACIDFYTGGQHDSGQSPRVTAAAELIAAHLHGRDILPGYACWTGEGRFLFCDDPIEVVARALAEGGARVLPMHRYLGRASRVATSHD